jgi:LemA protein
MAEGGVKMLGGISLWRGQNVWRSTTSLRENIQQATDNRDIPQIGLLETDLRKTVNSVFARAESYPELKANTSFIQLQQRMSELENIISDRRELYNNQVANNNTRIAEFPDVMIARLFGFISFDLLSFSAAETADIDVSSQFKS